MKIEELALNEWSNLGYPVTADGIVKLFERFLAAYAQQQEPVGWIDGEGDPYCQHGWGKKPPEGWTTCEENSYPVFRHVATVVPDDRISDLERQVSALTKENERLQTACNKFSESEILEGNKLALPTDDTALQARLKEEREKVISLYSPDDTAQDWIDKIRSMT